MMRSFSFSLFSAFKALPFWGSLFLLFNLMGCNPLDKNPSEISITSLSSTTGSSVGRSTITITGSNFVFIEGVNFGAKACTDVLLLDSSHLTCTVPRSDVGSATVSVVVYGKANRSASIPYTYVQAGPSITSFSPTAGALAAGTTINLIGAGFAIDSTVSIDGVACTSPVLASSTSLSCVLPARPAGSYSVVVTNFDGLSSTSVGLYTYQAAPSISSVSPAFGATSGSTALTITGTGFLAGAIVSIGGTTCPVTLVTPPNSISCLTLPNAAGIFDVKVSNLDLQQAAATNAFAYTLSPTPASVTPTSGALLGGTTITVYGSGFVSGSTVNVGGSTCTTPTVLNSSTMTCVTPGPKVAGAYSVVVTNPTTLTGTLISGYTYQPAPSLTSVSPNAGTLTGGTSVTLTGSNFLALPAVPVVKFGSLTCSNVAVLSSTTLTCTKPAAAAGAVTVKVTNFDNQFSSLASGYTYQVAPTVTSVLPIGGPLGGGTTITITGTGFLALPTTATVLVGGLPCTSPIVLSPTSMTCVTPAASTAGITSVKVTNADLQFGSNASAFTYASAPTVSSVVLNAGPLAGGTNVTVNGSGFINGASVYFGATLCSSSVVTSANTITCTTPAQAAGAVAVKVVNPDTQFGLLAGAFTYQAAPTVATVSFNAGAVVGSTVVTVNGTGFLSGATVDFGGSNCAISLITATAITCTTSAHAAGAVTVKVINTDNQFGTAFGAYTYQAAPSVTSVAASAGNATSSTPITITGTGFLTGAVVDLGGSACTTPVVVSLTTITCTAPAHAAGAVTVKVTNLDTQFGSLTSGFTYLAAPTVTSVSPNGGLPAGGTLVTITGTGFFAGAVPSFGGSACLAGSITVVSATSMTCTTTAHAVGAVALTVTNIDSQVGSAAGAFTYRDAPTVTNASPSFGPIGGGTVITITGTGFVATPQVDIGSVSCTPVTFVSSTSITCTTPLSMVSGNLPITVKNSDNQIGSLLNGFVYLYAPTFSGITPDRGPLAGGTTVFISGSNFLTGANVKIGTTPCISVNIASTTSLSCTLPSLAAGSYNVVITNPDSQSVTGSLAYTYQAAPTVTSISPAAGAQGGGTVVTITGTGFETSHTPLPTVQIGGSNNCSSVTVVSSTSLTCTTNAYSPGSYSVSVANSDGQSGSAAGLYTYQLAPSITSVSPNSGALAGGDTITITGSYFLTGATVTIGGTTCTSPTVIDSSNMTCATPAKSAGTYAVVVKNTDNQTGTLASSYTYRAAPTISSVSPAAGALAGSTIVTVNGTGFLTGATVDFGGSNCSISLITATAITCATTGHAAGAVTVKVTNTDAQFASTASAYTYQAAPTVSTVSPNAGAITGGTLITITGTGFLNGPAPTVAVGGTACTGVSYLSSTSIQCTTQAHAAGAVGVVVTNSDNQSSGTGGFTYQVAPTVFGVLPTKGALAGSTVVTISGSGFLSGAIVSFGGSNCSGVTVSSSTSLTCTTSAHLAGAVAVTVTNLDSQVGSASSAYTYQAAPTVASVSPASGSTTGGTAITVTGSGFYAGSVVTINSQICTSATVVSSSSITCTTPTGAAGAVAVSVTNLDTQQGSAAGAFTYQATAILAFQVGTASPTPPNPDIYGSTNTNITHTFTLENTGDASTTAVSVFLSGTSPAGWIKGTDNCNGAILIQDETCTIQLTFMGGFLVPGSYSAILNATATTGGSVSNVVSGTTIP